MTTDHSEVRGQSYLRHFGIVVSLFLAAVTCAALALTQGIGELRWVARYGRATEPRRYWATTLLAVILAVFWGYSAIDFARS